MAIYPSAGEMMTVFWSVLLVILLLFGLFLLITSLQLVRLELEYWREGTDDQLLVILRGPYGLVFQRVEVPVLDLVATPAGPGLRYVQKTQDKVHGVEQEQKLKILLRETGKLRALWRKLRPIWQAYRPALRELLRHVQLQSLTWETKAGVADAAQNGLLVGAIWALKGGLLTAAQELIQVSERQTSITVAPYFNHAYFSTYFHCIFNLRLVHVISVQWKLLEHKLRQRKR